MKDFSHYLTTYKCFLGTQVFEIKSLIVIQNKFD